MAERDVQDPREARRVWLLEVGSYEQRYVEGVFATPEAAMAAWPKGEWKLDSARGWAMRDFGFHGPYEPDEMYDMPDHWTNGLDWDDAAAVTPWDIQGPGDE